MKDELEKVKEQVSKYLVMKNGKLIIFSAPSGAGKSTIVNHLLKCYPSMEFSISACSRAPRGKEVHGKEYYFLGVEGFKSRNKK